ncbi:hypothetical protein O3P69_018323 [Scylla paramamosain]|uniref:Uncharacterized protein n=1 Tax=Scylla paramamosain TaxID=85552 RepID=A0AAW0TN26_SCYPA
MLESEECGPHSYIGMTKTSLSRRLTYHLSNGAIKDHYAVKHNSSLTRENLETIIITGSRYAEQAQRAIIVIARECQRLGLKINTSKTKAIHFDSKKVLPPLRLHEVKIDWVESHPYLGVWMDPKLKLDRHVADTIEKARMWVMRAITRLQGSAGLQVLRTNYIQAVRSVTEYGAQCLSTTSDTAITKLDKLQNQAMRFMVGAPNRTWICTLHVETNIPPLEIRLRATELLAILKALQHAELRTKPLVIHTDSMGSIQALVRGMPRDNVGLITSVLVLARRIPGNEEIDTAAKKALSLPTVTAHTPPHHVITYSHHVTTTYPHHHTMSPPPTHTLSPPPTHTTTPRYHPHLVTTIHPRHHTMSSATPCHHHPPTPPHHVTTHTIV